MSINTVAEENGLKLIDVWGAYDSYDWTEIGVWWSDSARKFFWFVDSGCSCYSWGDGFEGFADFHFGNRDQTIEAIRDAIGRDQYLSDADAARRAENTIRDYTPSK